MERSFGSAALVGVIVATLMLVGNLVGGALHIVAAGLAVLPH